MAISKKLRFEIFKRDGFACAYCGRTPPEVLLEIDHIKPRSKKGKDDINNLITACFDCNRGKRNIPLDKAPNQISINLETLKEKEEQLAEYQKIINKIERRLIREIKKVDKIFNDTYKDYVLSDKFKTGSLKSFLRRLPAGEVVEAMIIACQRINNDRDRTIRYFCGICWKKIKGNNDAL